MQPANLLFILSDEHSKRELGCCGNPHIRTPNLYRLAVRQLVRECEAALRAVVDPEAVDRLARADQRAMIEKHGGTNAILKRGTFRYSSPPGGNASYY